MIFGIIIIVFILYIVLHVGGTFLWIKIRSAFRKMLRGKKTDTSTETMRDIPEVPELSDEELRKKLRSLRTWMWVQKIVCPIPSIVGFVPLVVGFVVLAVLGMRGGSFIGMEIVYEVFAPSALVVAVMFVPIIIAYRRVAKMKGFMGSAVTLPVLNEIFDVEGYRPNGHLPSNWISSAGLVDDWTEISGSDYIEGSYKGVNILYSDLHLWHTETGTDSDGDSYESAVTDFKGQWLICDFGKELAATVRLIERKSGTKWQRTTDLSKSDIETENIEFNKKYRIITGDGHTAFYLLTPHFMERLVAANEAANASTHFCFGNGIVHIALYSGRDSFELKGVKLNDMESVRQKFRGDMKYMTDIMDELLLNDRLFKEN